MQWQLGTRALIVAVAAMGMSGLGGCKGSEMHGRSSGPVYTGVQEIDFSDKSIIKPGDPIELTQGASFKLRGVDSSGLAASAVVSIRPAVSPEPVQEVPAIVTLDLATATPVVYTGDVKVATDRLRSTIRTRNIIAAAPGTTFRLTAIDSIGVVIELIDHLGNDVGIEINTIPPSNPLAFKKAGQLALWDPIKGLREVDPNTLGSTAVEKLARARPPF